MSDITVTVDDTPIVVGVASPTIAVLVPTPPPLNVAVAGAPGPPGPAGPAGADSTVPGPEGPAGVDGPAGPPGTAYLNAQWGFNQNTAVSPASGTMRMNATTYAATTTLWIHETDRDGLDRTAGLNQAAVGDQIIMQSAQGRAVWTITAQADSGVYRTLTVTLAESTGNRPSAGSVTTLYFATSGVVTPSRATATKTTASLAANASEQGTITLANGYRLLKVTTSSAARVRLYTTTAKQAADLARAVGTDPTGDHGLMLEFVSTSGLLALDLSPTVDGFDGKTTPDGAIPYTITNLGTGSAAVTATLVWIRTE